MKKVLSIALPAILIAGLFTACTKESTNLLSKGNSVALNKSLAPVPSSDNWQQLPGTGTDIGIGIGNNHVIFAINTTLVTSATGNQVVKWDSINSTWNVVPGGAGVRIAVDVNGNPWVVNKSNLIYKYNGSTWTLLPGTGTDIGIGANGIVYAINTTTTAGGYQVVKWNGTGWTVIPGGSGIKIAVDATGYVWVVNKSNSIFKYDGSNWTQMPGTATDIGAGGSVGSSIYIVGTTLVSSTGGYRISKWNGSGWTDTASGAGVNIAVDWMGHPWATNASNLIYRNLNI